MEDVWGDCTSPPPPRETVFPVLNPQYPLICHRDVSSSLVPAVTSLLTIFLKFIELFVIKKAISGASLDFSPPPGDKNVKFFPL